MTVVIHVNDLVYAVDDAAVPHIEARILDAVRAGGGFIDVGSADARPTRVLVTPASTVRIETVLPTVITIGGDDAGDEIDDLTFLDLDHDFDL